MILPWQAQQWQQWIQQTGHLGQGYLLSGAEGIGLSEFAMSMAEGLLCQTNALEGCQNCVHCHQFAQSTHPDFFQLQVLEDKKEISIDQVRALTDKIYTTSHQGGYKVALIEQVELLNVSAFNALLKTLEEPPAKTILILTSYQTSLLPATIISRCRKIAFASPHRDEALAWLQQALPQADMPLLKKALKINWGGPIKAKTWIEEKSFELEAAWQEDVKGLQQGRFTVSQVVEKWKKYPQPEVTLDYFYAWSVNVIRAALYLNKIPYNPNWLMFQKSVLQARQFWHQNVNKDLLLEGVCLEWLQHQQDNYQPSDVFQQRWIRGTQV